MGWDGSGTFTRTNGVRSGTGTWAADASAGDNILASHHDVHDQDLAAGIQAALTKNNESKPTADFSPNSDNTYSFGTALLRWVYTYLSTGIKFVGASFTTTLGFVAPTAARALLLPDSSGTLALEGAFSPEYDNGNSGAALTVSFANGYAQKITLTADCTLTITPPASSRPGVMRLRVIQDATGSRALGLSTTTFPDGVNFPGQLPSSDSWLTIETDGTTLIGTYKHRQSPISVLNFQP